MLNQLLPDLMMCSIPRKPEKKLPATKNSFLRVIKPEIDLPESTNLYADEVYNSGKKTFAQMIEDGIFQLDASPSFYIYRLTMDGRTQTGMVGCCHFEEYYDGRIKKHELTRTAKENDRVKHVETLEANAEPVFFSYRGQSEIDQIVDDITRTKAVYDFSADDGIRHEHGFAKTRRQSRLYLPILQLWTPYM